MSYTYGTIPTREQIEGAIEVLKAERFARWQREMSKEEQKEIEAAHNLCIYLLRNILNDDKAKC